MILIITGNVNSDVSKSINNYVEKTLKKERSASLLKDKFNEYEREILDDITIVSSLEFEVSKIK